MGNLPEDNRYISRINETAYIAAVQEKKEDMYYLNALSEKGIEYEVKLSENICESNIFINGIRKIN